ncbi:6-hydroxymethylpterin diphosphokinase MptE-like protein [Cryobacterium sp. Y82]|uniref:6-hydroxymethylpterin diphosphokinase MptE-like protein n=1 Tax=Cryobacterium sp. Y82 TaxID=2045017 RepID=UPI0018EA70F7|nr:6-hydroxymethylpterin diphosphokinase MptE-like protein [Cryobacterium sp. Y82]
MIHQMRRAKHQLINFNSELRERSKSVYDSAYRANRSNLEGFKDSCRGERCVIIGNGPSLNRTDLSLLSNEKTFGLNRIYLMAATLGFTPTYHVAVNQLVVEQSRTDLLSLKSPLFTTRSNEKTLGESAHLNYLYERSGPVGFSTDASRGIHVGQTVTFVALQLAYHMGFSTVVLVGVDHSFTTKGPANSTVESRGDDPNHFDPNYFGAGVKWQLPDLPQSEVAYMAAREVFSRAGRRIVDATVDGKLEVFPKLPLAEALLR